MDANKDEVVLYQDVSLEAVLRYGDEVLVLDLINQQTPNFQAHWVILTPDNSLFIERNRSMYPQARRPVCVMHSVAADVLATRLKVAT